MAKSSNLWYAGGGLLGAIVGLVIIGTCSGPPSIGQPQSGARGPDFVVRVTGSPGVDFTGAIMSVNTVGQSVSKSVEGTVDTDYPLTSSMVSVSFQKKGTAGTLKVLILKGSVVKAQSETSAAYGVVSAATQ